MTTAEALATAHAAGIKLRIDGDHLVLEAPAPPPGAVLDLLSSCKADIVALLRSGGDGRAKNCADQQARKIEQSLLLLPDGRRLHRFRTDNIPTATPDQARELRDEARWRGTVLIPDGLELVVVEPWLSTLPMETLQAFKGCAGPVITVLREESRTRSSTGRSEKTTGLGITSMKFPNDFGKTGGA
jgi:hypothetical protein